MADVEAVPGTSPEDYFAENLRQLLRRRGMSQEALAAEMTRRGFSWHQSTVYKVLHNARKVTLGEASTISEIVNTPVHLMTRQSLDAVNLGEIRRLREKCEDHVFRIEREANDYDTARWTLRSHLTGGRVPDSLRAAFAEDEVVEIEEIAATDVYAMTAQILVRLREDERRAGEADERAAEVFAQEQIDRQRGK